MSDKLSYLTLDLFHCTAMQQQLTTSFTTPYDKFFTMHFLVYESLGHEVSEIDLERNVSSSQILNSDDADKLKCYGDLRSVEGQDHPAMFWTASRSTSTSNASGNVWERPQTSLSDRSSFQIADIGSCQYCTWTKTSCNKDDSVLLRGQ